MNRPLILLLVALYGIGVFLVLRLVGANRREPERELERWVREALCETKDRDGRDARRELASREPAESSPGPCDVDRKRR